MDPFHCPNCNHPGQTGYFYCTSCGTVIVCPRCRTIQDEAGSYCANCGQVLVNAGDSAIFRLGETTHPSFQAAISGNGRVSRESLEVVQQKAQAETPARDLGTFIPEDLRHQLEKARQDKTMAGERRVVTMLFCDVKGSTAAAEHLDPEDWAEIMNALFEHLIRPIYRYEGTVARLMGDAILAFFGAPIAHEDDPTRAILAGLDILETGVPFCLQMNAAHQIDINLRVGINTGPVMVGAVGSDLQMEYSALGDAINLAARMEQTAEPGTVQISADTYELVSPLFEADDLGEIQVKGKSEPIHAYRVTARKTQPGTIRGIAGLKAPLIGREQEWHKLQQAAQALERGVGRLIIVTGEAGLGKSRLIKELKAYVTPFGFQWHETSSQSYDTHLPYGLFQQLALQVLDASVNDSTDTLWEKFSQMVTTLPAEEETRARRVFAALFSLSTGDGTALEGEAFQREFIEFNSWFWEMRAHERPAILVFDDLHWADPASLGMIRHLIHLTQRAPLLIVAAMRPDRECPGWELLTYAEKEWPHRLIALHLEPLSEGESATLVDSLLTISDLPESLRQRMLEKAQGNPFFVEEIIRTLIETGVVQRSPSGENWIAEKDLDQIPIPENLHSLLLARIDQLEDNAREVLQLASVVGRTFYYRVIQAISGQAQLLEGHMLHLQQRALIEEAARTPELEYIFRHALTQEAAYQTILRKQRQAFHLQVGMAIERLFPERLDEYAPSLAMHFMEAGNHDKALRYYQRSGDLASRLYANLDAITYFTRAIDAAQHTDPPDTAALDELYLKRGRAMELNSNFEGALANYQEMQQVAQSTSSRQMELHGLVAECTLRSMPNIIQNYDEGMRLAEKSLTLAQELHDLKAEVKVRWNMMNLARFSNDTFNIIEQGEMAMNLARKAGFKEDLAFILNDLTYGYLVLNEPVKALDANADAMTLWRELDNQPMLADSLSTSVLLYSVHGEFQRAIENATEAWVISDSINNLWGRSYSRFYVCRVYWEIGEIELALEAALASLDYGEKAGFAVTLVWTRGHLSSLYANLGDLNTAREVAKTGLELAETLLPSHLFLAYGYLANVEFLAGNLELAQEYLDKATLHHNPAFDIINQIYVEPTRVMFTLAKRQPQEALSFLSPLIGAMHLYNYYGLEPQLRYLHALVHEQMGLLEDARESLAIAREKAEQLGAKWWLWQIIAKQAEMASHQEDAELAAALQLEANAALDFIVQKIIHPGLRESFLQKATLLLPRE